MSPAIATQPSVKVPSAIGRGPLLPEDRVTHKSRFEGIIGKVFAVNYECGVAIVDWGYPFNYSPAWMGDLNLYRCDG